MTIDKKRIYLAHLKGKAEDLASEPKWKYLYKEHLLHSLKLFNLAKVNNDNRFYRDCISRANKVLEGVIKLLYDKAKSLDSSLNAKNTLFHKTQELLDHNKISNIFRLKLDAYRDLLRNPETHQIFKNFEVKEAEDAINEALIFFNIGIENYRIIEEKRDPIDDLDYLYLLVDSFVECFAIFSQFFNLYDKRYNGIYSAHKDVLVSLLQKYFDNSIFSREFTLTKHEARNRLRPHLKITLGNLNITFTILRISDYPVPINQRTLNDKRDKYKVTFRNLYFLIWSFTRRSILEEALATFESLHHFHIDGLNETGDDDPQRKIGDFMMI